MPPIDYVSRRGEAQYVQKAYFDLAHEKLKSLGRLPSASVCPHALSADSPMPYCAFAKLRLSQNSLNLRDGPGLHRTLNAAGGLRPRACVVADRTPLQIVEEPWAC